MKRKAPALILIAASVLSLFTGCTKYYYEQEEAEDMAELGESIVSEYLEANNIDATISSCEATIYGVPVRYLTSYANGTLIEDGVTYEFYVDTETEQIYVGKYSEEISSVIESKFYDVTNLTEDDFLSIDKTSYGIILPNKWANENVPKGDVYLSACVIPIEVTDVEEYINNCEFMLTATFEGVAKDDTDLSFFKNTDYLNAFSDSNILPLGISVSNRLFSANMYTERMSYYEYELTEYEEFEIAFLTHFYEQDKDGAEDYVYDISDITIDKDGNTYNFSLLNRYDNSFATTRLVFYYYGENPPAIDYTFMRRNDEVTKSCHWEEISSGVWRLKHDNVYVFHNEEFTFEMV